MARVTYIGKAGRIRIAGGIVLERNVPTDVPDELSRGLRPGEFDVVMPPRRSPTKRRATTTKPGGRRARSTKKES